MTNELTDEELEYLQSRFDLARSGETAQLVSDIDAGLPVNLTNGSGDSLLILAAYYKQTEMVRALLARGADTERVNDRGQTALGSAVFRQAGDIVKELLAAGADPAAGGRSALDVARFFGLTEMLALLEGASA